MKVAILTESGLREAITIIHEAVATIEEAFGLLADGKVNLPPIIIAQGCG